MNFTERNKVQVVQAPINVRYDAPYALRSYLLQVMLNFQGMKDVRKNVCFITKEVEDPNNWSENDFMRQEILKILENCPWNRIYDLIEYFDSKLTSANKIKFEKEINEYFVEKGIGWKLINGVLESRGEEAFEEKIAEAVEILGTANYTTSKNEISEALRDMSKRPEADITGAIQHSLAALECLSREITGDKKSTLGKLINDNPDIVPSPLNMVISKLYGFASEQGRHLKEGKVPDFEEAELVVHLCASLCVYLVKKEFPKKK